MIQIAPSLVRKYLVAFCSLFDHYKILRSDNTYYQIPIRLATAEKILAMSQEIDTERSRIKMTIPAFGVVLTGLTYDPERAKHPTNMISSNDQASRIFQPVPYNITLELGILSSKSSELFNILEQILPFYSNHRVFPFIPFKFIDGSQIQIDAPIILDSSTPDIKSEIGANDENVYIATLNFTIKGWLFSSFYEEGTAHVIEFIDIDFENENSVKFESYHITEATGGDVSITVEGFV